MKKYYTIYKVGISGNERFPKNGEIKYIKAESAKDALKKLAIKEGDDKDDVIPIIYYKEFKAWADKELWDVSITIICEGKKHIAIMQSKASSIYGGDESEEY
jgi:hypothetical protein